MNKRRNLVLDLLKVVLAGLVVFIHCGFPGEWGKTMSAVGRIAVPTFLGISGYYSYGANRKQIIRRMKRLLGILAVSLLLYLAWRIWATHVLHAASVRQMLASLLTVKSLARLLFLNEVPSVAGHLWYIVAACECYLLYLTYIDFHADEVDYTPLYIVSFLLLAIQMAFGLYAQGVGLDIPFKIYRNMLFMGVPMFVLGVFLHQYGERVMQAYHLTFAKCCWVFLIGAALTVVQRQGIGEVELPFGTILEAAVLMLLVFNHPVYVDAATPKRNALADFADSLSLTVYIVHPLISDILVEYNWLNDCTRWIHAHKYVRPLIILGISLVIGAVLYLLKRTVNRIRKRQ